MIPNIAVILTDPNQKIIWVNEDFTSITGYSLGEAIGRIPGKILQGPKTEPAVVERIRKALQLKVPLKEQLVNYRKNGEEYLCKLVIHPVFNRNHELINFIAFEVEGGGNLDDESIPLLNLSEKYRSSSLRAIDEIKLYNQLKKLMEVDKLYLSADLTLKTVADLLDTNTKYLSQVVNHQAGLNFQQFVNFYRVDEAKCKIIKDSLSNLTLYGIALQCGFKNKSTFYKVFKELTGHTPKDFVKSQR
ncbi:helix-turn-helix domain-containing protein [Haliscomenobacter hydrossis]|uniref:Transcriptional regulator with PAS/PAC sensors, AraC family n=1 Tax=Haliscomenobacter hydrossis (strain ATCC 27775 / DSM 1100 / LMG 10767 / O) TaxID=760192 RepID=F4L696_HALH1|nr:helix-turn-helix domain-containing protein [Haliscomenobacter hydrossis]AEE54114.1 transcriptional regulator with PAS/PAC sensors, AraC family [Haliscomenobacter hydrossis DSM 1100]